jgi:prevent-host-death family protein
MQVGIRQAGRELSRLINQAVHGHRHITITSRGKPKAMLLSIEEYERLMRKGEARSQALEKARELRESFAARYGVLSVDLVQAAREEREGQTESVIAASAEGEADEPRN